MQACRIRLEANSTNPKLAKNWHTVTSKTGREEQKNPHPEKTQIQTRARSGASPAQQPAARRQAFRGSCTVTMKASFLTKGTTAVRFSLLPPV